MPRSVQPSARSSRVSSVAWPFRPAAAGRGPLRRFAETRGLLGRHHVPHVEVRLRAADGIALRGSYLPGPGGTPAAVLLVHGFGASSRKPAYAALADGLASRLPVLTIDLRGHGGSAGASTFGDREEADVRAGTAWLRSYGHDAIVVVGVSMGATAAMHAVWNGLEVGGLVTISAPARFRDPAPVGPLQRLETLWHSDRQRRLLRLGLGISLAAPSAWRSPPDPERMVTEIAAPLLLVHGHDDAYFPIADARDLAAAHGGTTTLWEEPVGFGHAEDGFDALLADRLTTAIEAVVATGRFPDRS